jgi:hypothetical protein
MKLITSLSARHSIAAVTLVAASLLLAADAAAQSAPASDQLVAALKQNLAESQKRLRQYEWIETTTISLKGEQKSRKQQRVYYGADGKLVKLPIGEAAPPAEKGGGGRRDGRVKQRVIENKKEDLQDYMEKAAALIHQYVPPDPTQLQTAKDAGKVQARPQADGSVLIECRDYVQPSDLLTIGVDAKAALLSAISVATYLEKPEETVALAVRFATLPDGTSYNAQTTLDVKAKNIQVVVANSGHRPMEQR